MYPTYVKENAIPISLICPRWFFDEPNYLEQPWIMSYSYDQEFTYLFLPNATTNPSAISEVDPFYEIKSTEAEYKRYAGNLYQNLGQNSMLNVALQAVEKQKEFSGATAEEFDQTFRV